MNAPPTRLSWIRSQSERYALAGVLLLILALMAYPDRAVAVLAADLPEGLLVLFGWITELGEAQWYLVPTGGVVVVLLVRRRLRPGAPDRPVLLWTNAYLFAAVAVSGLTVDVIKFVVGRARPRLLHGENFYGFEPFSLESVYYSFPSGHANTVFAFALATGALRPRLLRPMLGYAVVVASSRVVVGAHYPSDVIGGAAVALLSTAWLTRLFAERGWLVFPGPGVPAWPRDDLLVQGVSRLRVRRPRSGRAEGDSDDVARP